MNIALASDADLSAVCKFDRHIPEERLQECICRRQVYVLSQRGRVHGVLRYSLFWQTIPFLDLLYLDEGSRSQGYGSRMMAYWEDAMKRQGYAHVMLSTQEDESARFFYEKLGYRRIGDFLPPEQEARELMYCKEL